MQYVQKLAFVFVQTLRLNVEQRFWVDFHPLLSESIIRKLPLFNPLDFFQPFQHGFVVLVFFEVRQLRRILRVSLADAIVQKRAKFGVRLIQPPPMRNAVRNVRKFFRRIIVEIFEYAFFDDVAVQFRNAVHAMRADHRQIRHADGVVRNNRHTRNFVPVAGKAFPQIFAETTVDFLQYRINSRQSSCNQILRPRFKRFGKHGVIGIRAYAGGNTPGFFPAHSVLVD